MTEPKLVGLQPNRKTLQFSLRLSKTDGESLVAIADRAGITPTRFLFFVVRYCLASPSLIDRVIRNIRQTGDI